MNCWVVDFLVVGRYNMDQAMKSDARHYVYEQAVHISLASQISEDLDLPDDLVHRMEHQ